MRRPVADRVGDIGKDAMKFIVDMRRPVADRVGDIGKDICYTCHAEYYTIIDLCWGGHGVLLNSKPHIDWRGEEVNVIKFTVQ